MENDDLYVEQLLLGPMENFVYIIGSKKTREVALVDPAWDIPALVQHLDERDLKLKAALVTHYHPDHIGGSMMGHNVEGIAELLGSRPVPIYVNKLEVDGVRKVTGLSENDFRKVESGDRMKLGDIDVEFLHTPGHTPGSQCFKVGSSLVSGDTLFIQGCGRVDLPGSNPDDMFRSLQNLATLPDDMILLPGHNYSARPRDTLGNIKSTNAYMKIPDLQTWRRMMG